MRVLLIWPKFESFSFWNFEKVCELAGVKYMTPPLGLLTVAGLMPKDWELRLIDENVSPLRDSDITWADLVLVGSKIVHRERALAVIARVKALGRRVVVGGPDPTLSSEHYLASGADHLCLGEGEASFPPLLADLANGTASRVYRPSELPDLTASPTPRFDLIDTNDYLYVGIQYSRGCPYHCEFCNVIDLFSHQYRTKTLEQVLQEMQVLYDLGYRGQLDFFDDNLIGHLKDVKPFLRGIADWLKAHRYPFQLSSSVTINVAKDRELLALLREARFKYFLVGIETPDEAALRAANKAQNTGFSIVEAADRIYREAGATIHSGFLLGLDEEPANIADQIIDCIDQASIPWVMAGIVYPLPRTGLAKRLEAEGRLFEKVRKGELAARDQVSAGLQFKPRRKPKAVLTDLVRVMHHSFDPEQYFGRCAEVATKLNTVPNLFPGAWIFYRNIRTFLRLCVRMTLSQATRRPFWRALLRVVRKNPSGLEALAILSVLYVHFHAMLPYCYEKLDEQIRELDELGEEEWFRRRLPPAPERVAEKPRARSLPLSASS